MIDNTLPTQTVVTVVSNRASLGMIEELSLDDSGDDVRFVGKVANCLFEDGVASWGRVAGFLAFGAAVCRRLNETGRGTLVKPVGCEISTYLLTHQTEWLVDNNSWVRLKTRAVCRLNTMHDVARTSAYIYGD